MRVCLAKSCNPFLLICVNRLCHKYGDVALSTAFSCPPHTFTCVLYNEQHNLPCATTNDPLVSFQLPLLIKWLYHPCLTYAHKSGSNASLECVAHPSTLMCTPYLFVCKCHQSPRSRNTFVSHLHRAIVSFFHVEKYTLLGMQWYDDAESTTHSTSCSAT